MGLKLIGWRKFLLNKKEEVDIYTLISGQADNPVWDCLY